MMSPAPPPDQVRGDGTTDEQWLAWIDDWKGGGKWEGPGNPPNQSGCLVPLGVISRHNDRIRKREERRREAEAAAAKRAAADAALRDQLIAAAGGNVRLSQADKRKWSRLLQAWERRNNGDSALLLAPTIGRDKQTAETLIEDKILEPPSSFDEAANDNDQLRIAARMAGPLPVNQIKTVINKVRIFASGPAPRLDETVEATRAGWARP